MKFHPGPRDFFNDTDVVGVRKADTVDGSDIKK